MEVLQQYVDEFSRVEKESSRGAAWLRDARRGAIDRFAKAGFPSRADEEWRHTDPGPLVERHFPLAVPAPAPDGLTAIRACAFTYLIHATRRLAFVDGRWVPALSSLAPGQPLCASLAETLRADPARLEPHLGRVANGGGHAFHALNAALWSDGAFLHLPEGAELDAPVHLLFVTTARSANAAAHPRILVVAERGSLATVVEEHLSVGGGPRFTNSFAEIRLGENARVEHVVLQRESEETRRVAGTAVHLSRDASYAHLVVTIGGALVRNDLRATLAAEGAECALDGLYEVHGAQHVDHHTTIDHAAPHGTSREFYKGVLDGASRAVFHGRILVRPGAQKTDAMQTNRNLMLSDRALVNTNPQLQIHADDVKCRHGATIGRLSADELFYLRSRGIDLPRARGMLIYGFANEVIRKIRIEELRQALTNVLAERAREGGHD